MVIYANFRAKIEFWLHFDNYLALPILGAVGVEGHGQEHPLLLWDWVGLGWHLGMVHLIGYLDLAGNQSRASGATFSTALLF